MSLLHTSSALFLAVSAASAPLAFAQTPEARTKTQAAAQNMELTARGDFAYKANSAGTFEIVSSQLALKRSQNPEVRAFAEKMIADHTKASTDLRTAVRNEGLEEHPALLDRKQADMFDRLKNTSDDDFDDAYIDIQTSAHDDTAKLFRDYSENGPAGALKDFATQTLPTLNAHHEQIRAIDKRN